MSPSHWFFRVVALRQSLPFGQRPTSDHVQIARHLSRWQNASPTHRKLARAAKVCRGTVKTALKRLRALGLLDWTRQSERRHGRVFRAANRYTFLSNPGRPAAPLPPSKCKKGYGFSSPTTFVLRTPAEHVAALGVRPPMSREAAVAAAEDSVERLFRARLEEKAAREGGSRDSVP